MSKPRLYIIAGSNGAGKTTFAAQFLPRYAGTIDFINADLIAKGLSPFDVERAATAAGRIALGRFEELAASNRSFAIETTLSGRAYAPRLRDLKARDYELHLFFLWIPDPALAIRRIRQRVRLGGHNVPPAASDAAMAGRCGTLLTSTGPWLITLRSSITPPVNHALWPRSSVST